MKGLFENATKARPKDLYVLCELSLNFVAFQLSKASFTLEATRDATQLKPGPILTLAALRIAKRVQCLY